MGAADLRLHVGRDAEQVMSDAEKVAVLAAALNDINCTIFATGAPLGSERYFAIRGFCCDALRATGQQFRDVAPTDG